MTDEEPALRVIGKGGSNDGGGCYPQAKQKQPSLGFSDLLLSHDELHFRKESVGGAREDQSRANPQDRVSQSSSHDLLSQAPDSTVEKPRS